MIKYFGGKSKLIKYFIPYLPTNINKIIEPFVGGGSCTLEFSKLYPNIEKVINDIDYNLITFYKIVENSDLNELSKWFEIQRNSLTLDKVKEFRNILKTNNISQIERAFIYYTCDYCGYGGQAYATPTQDKFNQYKSRNIYKDLQRCKNTLRNCKIYNQDYTNINFENSFYYCDPPYYKVARPYYGYNGINHKGFNHEEFNKWITKIGENNKVMISYDDSDHIRELYKNWNIIEIPKNTIAYSPKNKNSVTVITNELLILNYKKGEI